VRLKVAQTSQLKAISLKISVEPEISRSIDKKSTNNGKKSQSNYFDWDFYDLLL
jgi:hypothetical protein